MIMADNDTSPPPRKATPEEVREYLQKNPGNPDDALPEVVPLAIKPEELQELQEAPTSQAPAGRRTMKEDPLLAPGLDTGSIWSRTFSDYGKVEVTPLERDLYFKAALLDEPVTFDIDVGMTLQGDQKATCRIRVQSLSNFEMDVLYRAAQQEQIAAGGLLSVIQLNRLMQQYCVILHIISFEGRPTDHRLSFPPVDSRFPDIEAAASAVRAQYDQHYKGMHPARYTLMLTAVRLFERKLTICAEALLNQNF